MPEFEFVFLVRDFIELGGNVLAVIAFVTGVMWTLIYERFWYFRKQHKLEVTRVKKIWDEWEDHTSWEGRQYRRMLISEVRLKLERGLSLIQTIVAVCPMFGLLGTVTEIGRAHV
jgi:biopolymer transport protein ExbB